MVSGGVWWCLVVSGSVGVCKLVLPELIDVYGQICLNVSRRLSSSLAVSHRLSPCLTVSHRFSPFLTVFHRFSSFLTVSHCFSLLQNSPYQLNSSMFKCLLPLLHTCLLYRLSQVITNSWNLEHSFSNIPPWYLMDPLFTHNSLKYLLVQESILTG